MTALIPALWREHVSRSSDSPSRRYNVSAERELSELQGVANFIQELARKLSLPLICINTAIVYTQRFYLYHSLTLFEKHCLGASALFLAAKVEDHPRKVEHVHQVVKLLGRANKEVNDADYIDDILFNENIILQTLGFEIYIEHPHTHVVRLCEMFKMSKKFSQTAYILATYCLQLTRMCLFNKPGIVACLCIRMACKMMNETPQSKDGKNWFQFGEPTLTAVDLEDLCKEFQGLLDTCPKQWKNKTLLNNHQNLANKMVLSSAGLPMFGDAASNSDSDLSNPSLTSIKRSSSLEQFSQKTPDSSSNTPQTSHRFFELPCLVPEEPKRSSNVIKIPQNEKKPTLSSSLSNINQVTPKKSVENHHQVVKHHSSAEKKKQHQTHTAPKPNPPEEKKTHHSRSLLKSNAYTEKHQPQPSAPKVNTPNEKKHHQPQKNHQPSHSAKPQPNSEKKHHPGNSSHHSHTAPKPSTWTDKKLYPGHWPQKSNPIFNLSKEKTHHHSAQSFQKVEPPASHKPKEQPRPSVPKYAHRMETKTHHSQNHRSRHASNSKPESSSSSSSQRALTVSYPKTDESHPDKKIVVKDFNQRKTSHSVNQALPDVDNWPPASLDFSCLSEACGDFDPWGALLNKDLSPQYHPIPRNPSLGSTSSGMNLLKISSQDNENSRRSSAPVGYDFGDHFAKRFKPN